MTYRSIVSPGFRTRALHWLAHEMRLVLPPMIFFSIGFNLIVFSINLVLAQYFLRLASFMTATLAALLVAKVVLVAGKMSFLRRFDTARTQLAGDHILERARGHGSAAHADHQPFLERPARVRTVGP